MRRPALLALVLVGCATDPGPGADPNAPLDLPFGPFDVAPGEEITDTCVQISLHNETELYVNAVELTTGPGFHHSNWFFVPERTFPGDDGSYRCDDRGFNEAAAAILGGVLFAQSTQAPHEVQQFPDGVAIKVPAHSKIVSQIHLLDATEQPLHIAPTIRVTPIAPDAVTTTLAGVSFQNAALALPPGARSRFTIDCDLGPSHQRLFGRDPDFKLYYALAHYHALGTGLTLEAVTADGRADTIYSTESRIGDALGGPLAPAFDMTGYTRLRMTCAYDNPRADVVRWGVGDQEMCVFLAFSDSTYAWGGGVLDPSDPQHPAEVDGTMTYENPCKVLANDATH